MRPIVSAVYKLEGDRLEILLAFRHIERLREMGRSLSEGDVLQNVEAVLRARSKLKVGVKVRKFWPEHGWFEGNITKIETVQSTIETDGRAVTAYQVAYPADGTSEDLEEVEIRKLLLVRESSEFKSTVASVKKGFDYLENRLTGNCEAPYDCRGTYELFRLAQVLDPSYAVNANLDEDMLTELAALPVFEEDENLVAELTAELAAYKSAARGYTLDHSDVDAFTQKVLGFWRHNAGDVPAFARVARVDFSMAPSSAQSEHVFSLLDALFGPEQKKALPDYVGGSLMHNYNKRGESW